MSDISDENFYELLGDILSEMNVCQLIDIPGIYEILSEYFNNEVLERYENEKDRKCLLYDICGEHGELLPPYTTCPLVKKEEEEDDYYFDCEELENNELKIIEKFIKERKL